MGTQARAVHAPGTRASASPDLVHLGQEWQAAGAEAGRDGGHGWPIAWRLRGGLRACHDAAGTVAGHAGWQPARTRTEVGPEHRLPRPGTGEHDEPRQYESRRPV